MDWLWSRFKKRIIEEKSKMGKHDDLVARVKARSATASDACDGMALNAVADIFGMLDQAEAKLAAIDAPVTVETLPDPSAVVTGA